MAMSKLALGAALLLGAAEMGDAFATAPGLLQSRTANHATIANRAGRPSSLSLRKSTITMMAEAKAALGSKAAANEAETR